MTNEADLTPLYRFLDYPDTPTVKVRVESGSDESNVYGDVVFKRKETRIRFDGEVYSLWIGSLLQVTTTSREAVERFIGS